MPTMPGPIEPDILVVGIATVDAIASPVDEFPRPGGLRFADAFRLSTGGCAVNVAIALARLGVPCDLVARVGRDAFGSFVAAELERHGVGPERLVRDGERPTAFTFVAVRSDGERSFVHVRGANAALARADVPAPTLHRRRFVLLTGIMLMDALDGAPAAELLRDARTAGAVALLDTVFVESAGATEWRRRVLPALPHTGWFVPSEPEAAAISGERDPARAARWFRAHGARGVVVKLGAAGAWCLAPDGSEAHVPPCRVEHVADTTGAGDCWCAGFLAGLRMGLDARRAVLLGNSVAAASIQTTGATAGVPPLTDVLRGLPP